MALPRHLNRFSFPREDTRSVGHLEVAGLLRDVGNEPLVENRLSADFNGRRDLRIWVGEMARYEADSLEKYISWLYTFHVWAVNVWAVMTAYSEVRLRAT